MSRLRELIEELCPDGVEYKTIKDVAILRNGKDHKSLNDGDIPVYGSGGVMRYVDTASYDKPSVLIPRKGSLDNVFYVDTPFWNVDTIFHTVINESLVIPKYFYYIVCCMHVENYGTEGARPSLTQSVLNEIRIPVPPIEVQREIVRILDSFQELDDALTAEIEAREKQYSLLSERLLSQEYLEAAAGVPIVQKPLKEIALVGSSKRVLKRDLVDSGIPFFRGTEVGLLSEGNPIDPQLFLTEETYASVVSASGRPLVGDLLLPSVNEAGKVWMVDTDDAFYLKDARVLWVHTGSAKEEVDCRYMRYALSKSLVDNYRLLASGAQFAELKISSLETAPILLPPVDVQTMVADKLDDARALLQDRTIGLPAERDARRKQFDYYRDRLLSFPEKEA